MHSPPSDYPYIRPADRAIPPCRDSTGPDVASVARVYDYLLGGGQNFAVDRDLAQRLLELEPDSQLIARHNRAFLGRAVRFLVEHGIGQFIDLGSGILTVGNVHEIAQRADPQARVVYTDNDPVAIAHGRRLLADNPGTAVIEADLRRTQSVLTHPDLHAVVDLSQPVAVLAVAVLHFLHDDDDPQTVMACYRDAVEPGSYLVISHMTSEYRPQTMAGISRLCAQAGIPSTPRNRTQIEALFRGWELIPPGLTWTASWRPEPGELGDIGGPAQSNVLAGVAVKEHSAASSCEPGTGQRSTRAPRKDDR